MRKIPDKFQWRTFYSVLPVLLGNIDKKHFDNSVNVPDVTGTEIRKSKGNLKNLPEIKRERERETSPSK